MFIGYCKSQGLPEPVAEHRFHQERRFRFDYAFLSEKIALEVEGGIFSNGRHVRGKGYAQDMTKYNLAASLGWTVLRIQPNQLLKLSTIELIKQTIKAKAV